MQTSTMVLAAAVAMAVLVSVCAAPMGGEPVYNYARPGEIDAEDLLDLLKRIAELQSQKFEAPNEAKRGMDFGLSRGFSGAGAAKHLMGLAAANFAGGPGRRRRSPNAQASQQQVSAGAQVDEHFG